MLNGGFTFKPGIILAGRRLFMLMVLSMLLLGFYLVALLDDMTRLLAVAKFVGRKKMNMK